MLRLYILRHAKSAWPMPSTGDHDRPLNKRGHGDLPKISAMLQDRNYTPKKAYCSSARRTQETWHGIEDAVPGCTVKITDSLYESTTRQYLATIRGIAGTQSVMLIGHNPVCDDLTRVLVNGDGPLVMDFLTTHFPTGGLAVLDFEADEWSDIAPASGRLIDFVRPRSL